jgi:hypothetical protein
VWQALSRYLQKCTVGALAEGDKTNLKESVPKGAASQ